jgi:isoleucyl-tRNA synthetase
MLKNLENFSLPEIEEEVLKFWKEHSIKEQAMAKNKKPGSGKFVFFEGPPTANGMPGLHHVPARSFKDIIPRFKAMQGYDVPRKAGWDTHGLPVELQAEKELGFKGKGDIEKYGIEAFNKKCRELVWKYRGEFEAATERLGFWLDLKNPYVTYENSYIESLWWLYARIAKKGYLKKMYKIVPWCTRCGTPLSSHELAQGYKEVVDNSVYVKFKLTKESAKKLMKGSPSFAKATEGSSTNTNVFVLSWTTTPWTLPGNVALAVGEKIPYALIQVGEEIFVIAQDRLASIFPDAAAYSLLSTVYGKGLVDLSYEPLFKVKSLATKKAHQVYAADFVTTTDGTGVVHTAVMYGEDDYELGKKVGLPQHHTVDEQGHFTKEVNELAGMYAKGNKTETAIFEHLKSKNLLLKIEAYKHDYPHCWRCGTPVLYYAHTSWFIEMSRLRKQLIANNQKINWTPVHIKDGRFGEWLREVKDWSISRNRYWGTPLPIWQSKDGKQTLVVSSVADFKKYGHHSGNRFFGMRHGEATHNIKQKNAGGRETEGLRSELTARGIEQVYEAAKILKTKKIDLIVASSYHRAQQTAQILSKSFKVKAVTDKRLGEIDCGIFNWQSVDAYHTWFKNLSDRWVSAPDKAETFTDVRRRMVAAIRAIDKKYKNKNILIISHGDPLWLLEGAMRGFSEHDFVTEKFYPQIAQPFEFDPPVLPFDDEGRMDLHRPYVDKIVLRDPKTKKELHRVKDVGDVWFDSGAMPYAQHHFPFGFAQGEPISQMSEKAIAEAFTKIDFPADYIAEGIDQTRGWFYTLLAISTALGLPPAYKNVICLGLIHDKNGQKMSKSKGNTVDPKMLMDKYGADVVRWYFYASGDPGEAKNFDEADLGKVTRRFIMILYNSFVFWNSYAKDGVQSKDAYRSVNVLDKWILARLHELIAEVTRGLQVYDIGKAALLIESFTDDMSRWYIRRSRDRFQVAARGGAIDEADFTAASATLREVLLQLSKVMAPFMPFFSEALYKGAHGPEQSVHLEQWPIGDATIANKELIADMNAVRDLAAKALALRAEAKIKVRQPLAALYVSDTRLAAKTDLTAILKDEVNVKEVALEASKTNAEGVGLDTVVTEVLKEEGLVRELVRAISGLRADAGYKMGEEIVLMIASSQQMSDMIQRYSVTIKKSVNAKVIELKKGEKADAQLDTKIESEEIWIGVRRI